MGEPLQSATNSSDALFRPFAFKSLSLRNRVVMAPMTRGFASGGAITDDIIAYYRRRAEAGVGLIISEGTGVDRPSSLNHPDYPHFFGNALGGWKRLIDEVRAVGGAMAPQLWHVGAFPGPNPAWKPDQPYESPSGIWNGSAEFGSVMSDADIADTIEAFATSAGEAKRLGFHAVELHGAHGYLIDQFFWSETNRRGDGWGGDTLIERSRFAVELLKAVRERVGPDFPIIARVSQWKQQDYGTRLAHDPAALEAWLGALVDAGADILHCSQRRFWEPEFEQSKLNFAGWAKKLTGAPTITVGSVGLEGEFVVALRGAASCAPGALDDVVQRLESEEFDLVAVGRALLQDPDWAAKIRDGRVDELMPWEETARDRLY